MESGVSSTVKTCLLGITFVIFASSRIMLTKYSSNDANGFDYLPAVVTVLSEALKLSVCLLLTFRKLYNECDDPWGYIKSFSCVDILKLWPWSLPGFFYFLDNLITFYVIASFETARIVLLSNFVIVSTSLLFRIVLKHRFTRIQWAALIILFLSIVSLSKEKFDTCRDPHEVTKRSSDALEASKRFTEQDVCYVPEITGERPSPHRHRADGGPLTLQDFYGFILVIFQCFIASFANIYNEKIFKQGDGLEESIYVQNSRLYLFGVTFNLLLLLIRTDYRGTIATCGLFHGFNTSAALLILDNAALGLTISLVLKYRDNMFHIMCSQLNTVFVILASVAFAGFRPSLQFFLQAPIVLLAIYVYHLAKEDQTGSSNSRQKEVAKGINSIRRSSSSSATKMLSEDTDLYTDSEDDRSKLSEV